MKTTKIDPANPPTASFGGFIIGQPNTNPRISDIVGGTATFEYDVWNQMVKSSTADGLTVNKYNADGLRVEKTVNDKTTKFLYEGDKVTLELDGKGQQTARNMQGTNLASRMVDGQTLNYLYNGHADVTSLVDSTGTVKSTYYYDAFGNQTSTTGNVNNPYTYSGYQYDKETGLYYLNSRMYDSKTARFMQEDTYSGNPNDPLSLNLYTYCANNPIRYDDPSGHKYDFSGTGHDTDEQRKTAFAYQYQAIRGTTTKLSVGASGGSVKTLQQDLINLGISVKGGADGAFGANTKAAVMKFQAQHGLTVDGIVGSQTLAAVQVALSMKRDNESYANVVKNNPAKAPAKTDSSSNKKPTNSVSSSTSSNSSTLEKVFDAVFPGALERAENRNNSVYDEINYLTFGLADSIKGTFAPEKPLSAQHWADSFSTAALVFPAVKAISTESSQLVNKVVKSASSYKGTTQSTPKLTMDLQLLSKGAGKPEVVLPSKPHTNGTEGHWDTILDEVDNMSNSGDYNKIYVNKGLTNEIPGAKPNRRPDVMGVRHDGKIDQVEVLSKTDDPLDLIERMIDNQRIIGDRAGTIKVRPIDK